ncbi:MAG: GNAT family N-acetyltransferase [Bacteroidales bacterium]|nr:GNAT family N-acetyltransferase [Bacteroidales bacterium]
MKIIDFEYSNSEYIKHCHFIRMEVFVKEQSIDYEIEFDGEDDISRHFLLFENDIPIATARLRPTAEGLKLERIASLKEHRNKGIGRKIIEYALNYMKKNKTIDKVYIHAQEGAVEFYKKLGFSICSDGFMEAGILHYKMRLAENGEKSN